MKNNKYSGFHKLALSQRAAEVAEFSGLTAEEIGRLTNPGALSNEVADHMIENVIGTYQLPIGVAMNFLVNGKEYVTVTLAPRCSERRSSSALPPANRLPRRRRSVNTMRRSLASSSAMMRKSSVSSRNRGSSDGN